MTPVVLYIHGKGGNAAEAEHYRQFFPGCEVVGMDYTAQTPWEAEAEFPTLYDALCGEAREIILIANSIGAYFAMHSLRNKPITRAYFISPVVDMQALIANMMQWANVTEAQLREKQIIPTDFGEALSWEYLCYVRAHPVRWHVPTHILYAGRDNLTSCETMTDFAQKTGSTLTIMPDGEHWFHTPAQMAFLDAWLTAHATA